MSKDKVLILIKNEYDRAYFTDLLNINGYETYSANTILNAVEIIQSIKPDLILLDLDISDMSAIEELNFFTPLVDKSYNIVLVCELPSQIFIEMCFQLGIYFFISKSFKNETVLMQIKQSIAEKNYRSNCIGLYDQIDEGLVYYDVDNHEILMVNDSFSKIVEIDKTELLKIKIDTVFVSDNCLIELINKNKDNVVFSTTIRVGNNSSKKIELKKKSFHFKHRQSVALFVKNKNETEILKDRIKMQQNKFLQQTKKAQMGDMISMIAHQWRQPLTAINAAAGMLELIKKLKKENPEQEQHLIEVIYQQIQYLTDTLDDFSNFYTPDKKYNYDTLDSVVTKALSLVKGAITNYGIKIIIFHNSKSKVRILKNELVQVVISILLNSKYELTNHESEKKNITIYTFENSDSVELVIFNNGPKIPEGIFKSIFELNFTTKGKKGTGIGLYMSKLIVENSHRGKIFAENLKNGVKFNIRIPKIMNTEK